MTINCCEVCLAVFICSVITIVIYMASWLNHEETEVRKMLFLYVEYSKKDDCLHFRKKNLKNLIHQICKV
jgi:hypothetical protein